MDKENNKVNNYCCYDKFSVKDSSLNFIFASVLPFVMSLILIVVFMILAGLSGHSYRDFIKTEFVQVVNLIFTPITFFLIYFFFCKKNKIQVFKASSISFKLDWRKILIVVGISVTSVFLVSPFVSLFDYGLSQLGYNPSDSLPYVMNNGLRYVVGLIAMAVLPAICEELMFRGLILKGLEDKFGQHGAVFISATMFMLLHGSLQQTIYQFLIGVLLGYVMVYGKNVLYPMIMHFVNNAIVVTMSFIYTLKGIDVNVDPVYSTAWDYIAPILFLLLALAILFGLIYLMRLLNKIDVLKKVEKESIALANASENVETTTDVVENNQPTLNEENNEKQESIAQDENINSKGKLTKEEKIYFWTSIGLSVFLWITNTVMQFFNLF